MSDSALIQRHTYELSIDNPGLFREILEGTWDEVARRIREDPGDIENVQLFRLFSELNKVALALSRSSTPVKRERVVDLERIAAGLPAFRQVELFKQAIEEIESHGGDASTQRAALENILGREGAEKALAIEGEADGSV